MDEARGEGGTGSILIQQLARGAPFFAVSKGSLGLIFFSFNDLIFPKCRLWEMDLYKFLGFDRRLTQMSMP